MRQLITGISLAMLFGNASAAICSASASQPVALIELYTSEGCSSCPPADKWLSVLARSDKAGVQLVPLALHVPYWDYIGWRDPYASPIFERRQREAVSQRHSKAVYTPQVLFNGRDLRDWYAGGADRALQQLARQPVRARLQLSSNLQGKAGTATITGDAPAGSDVILVRYENDLVSKVASGENAGVTLRHDQVVRDWVRLGQASADGKIEFRHVFADRADIRADRQGLAAFVQDARGDVLQAVMLAACTTR